MGNLRSKNEACKNIIIAIGINRYLNATGISLLNSCETEVKAFMKVLMDGYLDFESENVHYILGANATKENIILRIKEVIESRNAVAEKWNLLVYFAGNTHFDETTNETFFIPYNAQIEITDTYLAFNSLKPILSESKAQHLVLFIDSSNAASLFKDYKEKDTIREYKNPSRYAFTSGRHDSISKGFKRKSSPFTQVLIKILQDWSHKRTDIPLGSVKERMSIIFQDKYRHETHKPQLHPIDVKGHEGGGFAFFPKILLETQPKPLEIYFPSLHDSSYIPTEAPPRKGKYTLALLLLAALGLFLMVQYDRVTSIKSINKALTGLDLNLPDPSDIPDIEAFWRERLRLKKALERSTPRPLLYDTINIDSGYVTYIDPNYDKNMQAYSTISSVNTKSVKNRVSDSINIVFAGSFQNKDNALRILEKLKKIGYTDAEIIMKEQLPYLIVVSGFDYSKKGAKATVQNLEKAGIESYRSVKTWQEIYRKK